MQYYIRYIVLTFLFSAWTIRSTAEPRTSNPVSKTQIEARWKWAKQKSIGSDVPCKDIRRSVDRLIAQKRSPQQIVKDYNQQLTQKGFSRSWAFGSAYAAYWSSRQQSPKERMETVSKALNTLMLAKWGSPLPYEVTRLRFLLECQMYPDTNMRQLGELLLRHNPSDRDIKYHFVRFLNVNISQERLRSIQYARDLVRGNPQSPDPYIAAGWVYVMLWYIRHEEFGRSQAIDTYNDYLRVAPANHYWRSGVLKQLRKLKSRR